MGTVKSTAMKALCRRMPWLAIVFFVGTTAATGNLVHAADETEAGGNGHPKLVPLPETPPAPEGNPTTPAKADLGKLLFFDPRLSGDNTMSCATCHPPGQAFADGRARAKGNGGMILGRNTPTVLNVGWHSSFFWDGRAASLEEQALIPITAGVEMNQDLDELESELSRVPAYVRRFREVFGTRVDREGIARALATFQRTLISRNSPFDRYLAGDKDALSAQAKRGLELFTGEAGCVRCHHGPLLSDGKFYRLGVGFDDKGRAAVTGNRDDRYKFRTPSLRDVAETGPYMHDGSLQTLEQVVAFYYRTAPQQGPHGLDLDIQPLLGRSYTEVGPIVAFLKSLSGESPPIERPDLP